MEDLRNLDLLLIFELNVQGFWNHAGELRKLKGNFRVHMRSFLRQDDKFADELRDYENVIALRTILSFRQRRPEQSERAKQIK